MTSIRPVAPPFWPALDAVDDDNDLAETAGEAAEFAKEVEVEVRGRQHCRRPPVSVQAAQKVSTAATEEPPGDIVVAAASPEPSRSSASCALDGPTVTTPDEPTALRDPPRTSPTVVAQFSRSLAGPSVASPLDTPVQGCTNRQRQAKRDIPDTPLPLGEATFAKLRQKKEFQTMSKHFELFEKGLARTLVRASSTALKGKGKQVQRADSAVGKVLDGCRICLPLDSKGISGVGKHKDRWSIVSPV